MGTVHAGVERRKLLDKLFVVLGLFVLVAAAAVLLALFLPVAAAVAAGVKLSSPGPVLYRQRRLGYKGKEFELIKFRSPRVECPGARPAWAGAQRREWGSDAVCVGGAATPGPRAEASRLLTCAPLQPTRRDQGNYRGEVPIEAETARWTRRGDAERRDRFVRCPGERVGRSAGGRVGGWPWRPGRRWRRVRRWARGQPGPACSPSCRAQPA